jgi:hypothetical protein
MLLGFAESYQRSRPERENAHGYGASNNLHGERFPRAM